ncbi:MAG: hypothetical protein ISS23_02490 [Nanoarchaeota archaeon]|nr:hypothetical protein [Nanoarchaeota archaeon]
MEKDIKIRKIELDENKNPTTSIEKKLEDFEVLKIGRIKCNGYPSLCEGIKKHISKYREEWNLKDTESIGFLMKGKEGYNVGGYSLKTVIFYKIRDSLD